MTNKKSPHEGHRQRLKKRYLLTDGKGFSEHEILELLLFYAIKRQNTNELAHDLIEKFGSINNMIELSIDELKQVKGVGDECALLLKVVFSTAKKYVEGQHVEMKVLNNIRDVVMYADLLTLGAINEQLYGIFLDDRLQVIDTVLLGVGSLNLIRPILRIILEQCLFKRATQVILFHNHPKGELTPSREDIDFTLTIERELDIINVRLIEHVIINGTGDYSLILKPMRDHAGYIDLDSMTFFEEKESE